MPVIRSIELNLVTDIVLDRLPLSSPAFASRPAHELVDKLLAQIQQDHLLTPMASYDFHHPGIIGRHCIEFELADKLLFASWTLGHRISHAVSEAFAQKRYLAGFLLHEIASLYLFQLGEHLFERLSVRCARQKQNIGSAIAPGDGILALSMQDQVLALSGAGRININGETKGSMSPLKSATAIAAVGKSIVVPGSRWSCEKCRARDNCRLRSKSGVQLVHDRLC